MIQVLLYISDSMGERFFVGAIQGLIGAIILYFWLRHSKKKEKKQYEKALKEEIYHDSSPQTTASSNTIEVDYYNTLYDELKEKCNPAIYMNPYNAEKVEISNQIYSQLDSNKENVSYLIELRNLAIKKLGLSFSAKELFEKLSEIYNPNNYVGEKYDADKLHISNQIYAKIQKCADDIVELENIAKENCIVLKGNTICPSNVVKTQGPSTNNEKDNNNAFDFSAEKPIILIFIFIVICLIIALFIKCVG